MYSIAQIVSIAYENIKNAVYIKTIVENGLIKQGLRKPRDTRLSLQGELKTI